MYRTNYICSFKKSFRPLVWILFVAFATGMSIDTILFEFIGIERQTSRMGMFTVALFYTLVFVGFDHLAHWIMTRYTDGLKSRRDVIIHIVSHSGSMISAFFVATISVDMLNYYHNGKLIILTKDNPAIWVIASISFTAAILGAIMYYGIMFYHKMREAENAALQAQFSALKSQVNPHFLFNSLNSIASLIRTQPQKAEAVTQDLADLFRYSLKSSKHQFVTIAEEFEALEYYMQIEGARFGDKLIYVVNKPDSLDHALMPGFLIQPLVENSVKHGASQQFEDCTITVDVNSDESELVISVTDTGPGFSGNNPDNWFKNGTGLSNIKARLEALYPQKYQMHISGQTVTIRIPLQFASPKTE